MSDLIQKIKKEELAAFLLNPYKRTARLDNSIFQKYTKDLVTDDIGVIRVGSDSCWIYGCVNYEKKIIIIEKEDLLNYRVIEDKPFYTLSKFRSDIKKYMLNKVDEMKVSRYEELKSNIKFATQYGSCKSRHYERIVFSLLGAETYYVSAVSYSRRGATLFTNALGVEEMVKYLSGDKEAIEIEIEYIFMSHLFWEDEIILPKLIAAARKAIETGNLSERQKHLKNFLDKTKDCGAKQFTVEISGGEKYSCENKVESDGKLNVIDGHIRYLDFERIQKVTYKGKVIYDIS